MYKQLGYEEAQKLLAERKKVIIADVRDETSYRKGHIKGATHLTMQKLQDFCNKSNKSHPILVYCYHGISSQSVAQLLVEQGFTEVYSLTGGFETWLTQHSVG